MKKINFTKALLLGVAVCLTSTIMFSQSLLWENRYTVSNGDQGVAVYVDASGNVYTGGHAGGDIKLIKYTAAGTQAWVATYNGPGNGADETRDIAAGTDGYIYVTGSSYTPSSVPNMTLIKYNTAGAQQWVSTYTTTVGGVGNKIKISGQNIYVCGQSNNSNNSDATLLKYNTAGSLQWAYNYNGTASGFDSFRDMDVCPCHIYLTGKAGVSGPAYDVLTVKVSSAGSLEWSKLFNQTSIDEGFAINIDVDENAYIAGQGGTATTNNDGLVLKYNGLGALQWSKTYDGTNYGGGNEQDIFYSLVLSSTSASNPDVYVTGSIQQAANDNDYATCKYNSSGTLLWEKFYDGAAPSSSSDDRAVAVLRSTNTGKIFVTGRSWDVNNGMDIATIRYNPSTGAQEWVHIYDYSVAHLNDVPHTYFGRPLAIQYNGCYAKDFIYVTGESEATGINSDIVTLKYGYTGPCTGGSEGRYMLAEGENIPINYALYPNPFTDFAVLRINSETEITNGALKVYDLFGKMVSSVENISSNQIIIEKGNMPAGIYVYQFSYDGGNALTGKMLIQ